ncbi:unnamed protein product [Macrosiphum euphorbiae]|uniref:Uncharacterized protein n=1 Tax=Macrosiphum euphorbiae TaxID=13131 RepID=A0AAV0X7Q0_9HEMI|nr:unnamed protein product [Macrosiphum euphorbiae]
MNDRRASGGAAFRSSGHAAGGAAGVCAQRWRPFPPVRQAVCAVPDKHVLVRIAVTVVMGGYGVVLLGNTPGYPPRSRQHTGRRRARHATAALSSVQFEQPIDYTVVEHAALRTW